MNSREILEEGVKLMVADPGLQTFQNMMNVRIAARLTWELEEMGGAEHVQFAYRNRTPIVPLGHCCHPLELVKRGFVDGVGWPKPGEETPRVKLHKWPDGNHWYAYVDGEDVVIDGEQKWNTSEEAQEAAREFIKRRK